MKRKKVEKFVTFLPHESTFPLAYELNVSFICLPSLCSHYIFLFIIAETHTPPSLHPPPLPLLQRNFFLPLLTLVCIFKKSINWIISFNEVHQSNPQKTIMISQFCLHKIINSWNSNHKCVVFYPYILNSFTQQSI